MKKGLSDAVFIPRWDTHAFLQAAGEAGFDGVELNLREKGGTLTFDTSPAEAKSLAKMAEKHGLEIASLSTGLHNHYALSSGDDSKRRRGEEIGLRMIELAARMGVSIIQIVPGVVTPDVPYDDAFNRAQESLARLGSEASRAGITIGIENVCNKFLPSPLEFVRFLDELNSPSVQAYFDNGNAAVTGHPEHFIQLLGRRIVAMHLKDYRESVGDFVSILEGDINWSVIMKALSDIPYAGYAMATPPYPYAHFPERAVDTAFRHLVSVLELSEPVENR
ncbi:MAG TPA: sugar phosphate isomerase/epimerase family protein [Bacillales bacterium]|nr:sugar phosphate isomerase/epimerase family protein [Bacillales bacterium]